MAALIWSLSQNPLFFKNPSRTQACAEFDNEGVDPYAGGVSAIRGREAYPGSCVRMEPYPGGV
jgi:hypothetical protein